MKRLAFPFLLVIITLASFAVRWFRVGESPPSLNWDEAALGYNAYSLLKTGKDEYSAVLPISLRSFDDYKPAVYAYLIVPWLTVLPLADSTVRLPSVIFGAVVSFSLGLVSWRLTKSKLVALSAAILVTFEPWALHFSRVAFESNVANSLLYLGLAAFLAAVKKPKSLTFALCILSFILSMYTYHSQRFITLPLILVLTWLFRLNVNWRKTGLLVTILLIPLAINFFTSPLTSRLTTTNIFKLWPFIPESYPAWIYNPGYSFAWYVVGKWLTYFSPVNLYLKGSAEPGQYVPTLGLLQLIELPLLIVGLKKLIHNQTLLKFVLPMAILVPLPAVVTWNWFSEVRTLALYPLYSLLSAVGLAQIIFWKRRLKYLVLFITTILYIPSTIYLFTTELLYAPAITYGEYQPGFENSIPILLKLAQNYDHVIIDSPHIAPYIFLLFYGHYNPAVYQAQAPVRVRNSGTESQSFAKFEFRQIDWPKDKVLPHTLFLGPTVRLSDRDFKDSTTSAILKDVYDTLGYISFRIVTTK